MISPFASAVDARQNVFPTQRLVTLLSLLIGA